MIQDQLRPSAASCSQSYNHCAAERSTVHSKRSEFTRRSTTGSCASRVLAQAAFPNTAGEIQPAAARQQRRGQCAFDGD